MIPPDAKMGSTNLACRHCDTPIDILQIPDLGLSSITPDSMVFCPYCGSAFFPEVGLLHSLFRNGEVESEYYGLPLSLGGAHQKGLNSVNVGEHHAVKMTSLKEGYEYDSIYLLGAHRSGVSEGEWLPFDIAGDKDRAMLGDGVLISLLRTSPTEISIAATIEEDSPRGSVVNLGDEIDIIYRASTKLEGVTNPAWVDLLKEAQAAIRQGNTLAALPVLRSAVDNCLIRQAFIYQVWNGRSQDKARQWVENLEDRDPNRVTIAKDGLEEAVGVRLTSGPYAELWDEFFNVVQERDDIIHSETASELPRPDKPEAVDFFNTTVSLLVATYDLFEFPDGVT